MVGWPGTLNLNPVTFNGNSKSKSSNLAPTVEIERASRCIFIDPSSPLTVPVGFGKSLILNVALSLTVVPSNLPVTLMVTSLPCTLVASIIYLLPPTLLKPWAAAVTLLSAIPANEIVIGFGTPRYTTFILSAEIVAAFGFETVAKD